MPVLSQSFNGPLQSHSSTIDHAPRVRVMAVKTTPLTTSQPGNDAYSRPVDGRAGSERVDEAKVTGLERSFDDRLLQIVTLIDAQLERRFGIGQFVLESIFSHHLLVVRASLTSHAPWNVRLI